MEEKFYNFNTEEFKKALQAKLKIDEIICSVGCLYISFQDSNIKYIRVRKEYRRKNNCINIYHHESTKNGYWWDGELNYNDLVKEILSYQ